MRVHLTFGLLVAVLAATFLPMTAVASGAAKPSKPAAAALAVDRIVPAAAHPGDLVSVTGRGFGARNLSITVCGRSAQVRSATGASASFVVPVGVAAGVCPVTLTAPGGHTGSIDLLITGAFAGTIVVTQDAARRVTRSIGPGGGPVVATSTDGTRYELQVPSGAVPAATSISLTPLSGISGLPLTGGSAVGVQFAPEGLAFAVPAILTITLAAAPTRPIVAFSYAGSGASFQIVQSTTNARVVTLEVPHFSGAGAGTANAGDFAAIVTPIIAGLPPLTLAQMAQLYTLVAAWTHQFGDSFCETTPACVQARAKVRSSLLARSSEACTAVHPPLNTTNDIVAAIAILDQLSDLEAQWGLYAFEDAIPVPSGSTTTTTLECQEDVLTAVLDRAIQLATDAPFAISQAGTPNNAGPDQEKANVQFLVALGALASQLTLDDLADRAAGSLESIFDALIAAAVSPAVSAPLETAPPVFQSPWMLRRADYDGDGSIANLEAIGLLAKQADALALSSAPSALDALEDGLSSLRDTGFERCDTDIPAGTELLTHGRTFATGAGLMVQEFDEALGACPVRITISPTALTVTPDAAPQQFTAVVTGTTDTSIDWSSSGTVDPNGLFSVPLTPGVYTVTASSHAFPIRKATATVTVGTPIVVSIAPTSATLAPGASRDFTAIVTGVADTSVSWIATGGTVSSTGTYTANSTEGVFSVTAISVADPAKSATAVVTIQAPAAPIFQNVSRYVHVTGEGSAQAASEAEHLGCGFAVCMSDGASRSLYPPFEGLVEDDEEASGAVTGAGGASGSFSSAGHTSSDATVSATGASFSATVSSRSQAETHPVSGWAPPSAGATAEGGALWEFTLNRSVTYSLTATVTSSTGGVSGEFSGGLTFERYTPTYQEVLVLRDGTAAQSGTLLPGRYALNATTRCAGGVTGTTGGSSTCQGSVTFTLTLGS